jgi:transposase
MQRQPLPLAGAKFGDWTATGESRRQGKKKQFYIEVTCVCGTIYWRELSLLRSRVRQGRPQGCMRCRHMKHGEQTIGSYMRAIHRTKCPWMTLNQSEVLAKQACFYCGAEPQNQAKCPRTVVENFHGVYQGIDEVVYGAGHTIGNILPCCITCNKAKNNRSLDVFCAWYNRRRPRRYQLTPARIVEAAREFGWVLQTLKQEAPK